MSEPQCPYCITGGFGFEQMVRKSALEYVCLRCGHVSSPANPWIHCPCERCHIAGVSIAIADAGMKVSKD